MSNLSELIAQKQGIEAAIAEVIKTERKEALQTVKTLMIQFSITADELVKNKITKKVAPKWKDPVSGKEWSGRGRSPLWFNEATAIAL